MPKEKLDEFVRYNNLFGNASILEPGKNREIKNKDLTKKIKEYKAISSNNWTIRGKDGFLDGINKLDLNNSINKLDLIYKWIDKRTDQLIGIIEELYYYK